MSTCGGKAIDVVCTMATPECRQELLLFLRSLRVFHPRLPLVIGCSRALLEMSSPASVPAWETALLKDAHIQWIPCLDQYGVINRGKMEQQRGVWFASRHTDFMMEKANLMEHAMATTTRKSGANVVAAFVDCDVCFLGPLPTIPQHACLALSPHHIARSHEALFGEYNGGYVVADDPQILVAWRAATHHSRFFDQASLEAVAAQCRDRCHRLPPQHNYGYWRLLQTVEKDVATEAAHFAIARCACDGASTTAPSILYKASPLASVHTHFFLPTPTEHRDLTLFNALIKRWVHECVGQGNDHYRDALAPLLTN